jgi:hypothetical protein
MLQPSVIEVRIRSMILTGGLSNYEQCCEETPQENPEAQVQKAEKNDAP